MSCKVSYDNCVQMLTLHPDLHVTDSHYEDFQNSESHIVTAADASLADSGD